MILAGDIGGTNTRLALVDGDPREPAALETASFAIAGPVRDGRVQVTNLAWSVDAASLASRLGLGQVHLLNDLEANAWGLPVLGPGDFHVLNTGAPGASGNAAVCSAGTGLGEAGMYWDGMRHHPFACEGGHTDFAPLTVQQ